MSATVIAPPKPTDKADVQTAAQRISPPRAADPLEPLDRSLRRSACLFILGVARSPVRHALRGLAQREPDIHKIKKERPGLTNLATPIEQSYIPVLSQHTCAFAAG